MQIYNLTVIRQEKLFSVKSVIDIFQNCSVMYFKITTFCHELEKSRRELIGKSYREVFHATTKEFSSPIMPFEVIVTLILILALLCTRGALGVWSLPDWSEGPQMLVQFIYDNENWFYEKKISNFFSKFLSIFSVFWTPFTHKKIFLHFWAKNNLLLYTWRATCPFDPQKMLFRGSFYKVSLKCPPP